MDLLLTTINARYQHASLGLRYLFANLGEWQSRTKMVEFTLENTAGDIVESILKEEPRAVGFGVYIWNVGLTLEVVEVLRKVAPQVKIVLGGPEISYEIESQPLYAMADAVIPGEGETRLRDWCDLVLGKGEAPASKIRTGAPPEISSLKLPYELYSDEDIRNRIIYVEASRGCAYRCEFCLSALDEKVRSFPLELFLKELEILLERGCRQFKFVDRTFNLSIATSARILDFFLERISLGIFLHFEMVPERLPDELKQRIKKFPQGALQFEVGIQTWNEKVSRGISRPQNYKKIEENLIFLREETQVHLHTDLIVGLPGENLESFGIGFDQLYRLRPHEIQIGILKRLRGMPLNRQTESAGLLFSELPPYSVLRTNDLTFSDIQSLKRFSKYWDLIANRGQFSKTMEAMGALAKTSATSSFFNLFWELSNTLAERHPKLHSIGLESLTESLACFFAEKGGALTIELHTALAEDYSLGGKRYLPAFLRPFWTPPVGFGSVGQRRETRTSTEGLASKSTPRRQLRHQEN